MALLAAFPSWTLAGIVVTAAGRHEGPVALTAGSIRVGEKSIAWSDVLLAINDPQAETPASPETVHFTSGEILLGKVRLAAGRCSIQSPLVGERKIDLKSVRAIDFVPELPLGGRQRPSTLYRRYNGPLPCSIVWIQGERVAIRSVVGAVALQKRDLSRFVFQAESAAPSEGDEITLIDGSVLRGRIEPADGGLMVNGELLGQQRVVNGSWQSMVRAASERFIHLAQLQPLEQRTFTLIRRAAEPPRTVRAQAGVGAGFVQRTEIWPRSAVSYRVPGKADQVYTLSAGLGLASRCRGAAQVRVSVDGRVVFERLLEPGAEKSAAVMIEAAGGTAVKFDVDFGPEVRFPCCVVVDDAMLVRK